MMVVVVMLMVVMMIMMKLRKVLLPNLEIKLLGFMEEYEICYPGR